VGTVPELASHSALRTRGDRRYGVHLLVAVAVIAWLVLPPLFFLLQTSVVDPPRDGLLTFDHYATVIRSFGSTPTVVTSSLAFSLGSAVLALLLGCVLAWLAERTDAPFRGAAYTAAFVSFALPGVVKVVGWILLLGPRAGLVNVWLTELFSTTTPPLNVFTLGGMIAVEALLLTPLAFLFLAPSFRSIDGSIEDAARTCGAGPWATFFRISMRLALPSVLAVLLLNVARSLEAFETPVLIGIPAGVSVFTTEIYLAVRGGIQPRYGVASAYAVLLIVLIALALYPYYRLTRQGRRFATIGGRGFRSRVYRLGPWRPACGLLMIVLSLLFVLPLLVLVWASLLPFFRPPSHETLRALTLDNYSAALANRAIVQAAANSLVVSASSAVGTLGLASLAAWLVVRTQVRGGWALDQLAMLPLAIPGIVLGIAVLRTYLFVPVPLYGTIWIFVVAFLASYLPYGMRYAYAGLLGVRRELEESSRVLGAGWLATLRRVTLPLIMPTLFSGGIYVFLVTARELSIPLLLYGPESEVVAVIVWELWENGRVGELSAFSVLLSIVLVALALGFWRVAGRYGRPL
jgi:iron(III) transport system permease protein